MAAGEAGKPCGDGPGAETAARAPPTDSARDGIRHLGIFRWRVTWCNHFSPRPIRKRGLFIATAPSSFPPPPPPHHPDGEKGTNEATPRPRLVARGPSPRRRRGPRGNSGRRPPCRRRARKAPQGAAEMGARSGIWVSEARPWSPLLGLGGPGGQGAARRGRAGAVVGGLLSTVPSHAVTLSSPLWPRTNRACGRTGVKRRDLRAGLGSSF